MDDVAKPLETHKMIHLDRLGVADAVHVVASQVHEHDVLCAVLIRVEQLFAEALVLCNAVRHSFRFSETLLTQQSYSCHKGTEHDLRHHYGINILL